MILKLILSIIHLLTCKEISVGFKEESIALASSAFFNIKSSARPSIKSSFKADLATS